MVLVVLGRQAASSVMGKSNDNSAAGKPVTAGLVIIGNEILSGRTRDAVLAHMAIRLNEWGVQMREVRVVPDDMEAIAGAVNALRGQYNYVFTTGGIGPTHDDITADAIAAAFGVPLEQNAEAVALLETQYGGDLNEARLRMARVPRGGRLVENPVSMAPGFEIENVFVLAGVPVIMRAMLESVRHRISGAEPVQSRTVKVFRRESDLAAGLEAIQARYGQVDIGSYPFFRNQRVGANLVLRSPDTRALDAAASEVRDMIRDLGEEPVDD